MNFKKIDMSNWDRLENYTWFTTKNRCKINMTMNVDVTKLVKIIKEKKLRHYTTFTYIVSKVVNANDEFKMNYDEKGDLGIYDIVHPRYPIFHESDKRLSVLWTEYSDDFNLFYDRFIDDVKTFGEKRSMAAKGPFPPNCFDISSLPWSSFTSFNCPQANDIVWLPPFVMVGRYFENIDKILLPVSISVHHATCDGYHVSKFFNEFQNIASNFDQYI